ncbi:MAG: hypothetical protein ACLGI6_21040, partial [Gammaproteobacteria bacterium]
AGQLLTDEDLQALTDYVLTKQRMHNRFLVGSGVGCGLAVTCHPCGGGRVIVQPGYAVDCCGNEILVPCAVELDINAMVRALKVSMHGQDCGDPCATPLKDRSAEARAGSERSSTAVPGVYGAGAPGTPAPQKPDPANTGEPPPERGRRYCLYIDYCEEPGDLVAPYSQDDSCAVTCRPSRVREGFSFQLRCAGEAPRPPSIADRLECCIGDLHETDRKSRDIERAQAYVQRNRIGAEAYRLNAKPAFDGADAALVADAEAVLGQLRGKQLDQQHLRTLLDQVHAVGAASARFHLLDEGARAKAVAQYPGLEQAVKSSAGALETATADLEQQADRLLASPFERTWASTLVAETRRYANAALPQAERATPAATIYAYNGVSTPALNVKAHESLGDFKAWLRRKLDACPPTGQCGLAEEVEAIVLPGGEESTEASVRAVQQLVRALMRYVLDCICSALLPPCPSCDDSSVKLACLELDDCNVREICNLERTFLLTAQNLRYWVPLLHSFGAALERLCCEAAGRLRVKTPLPSLDAPQLGERHAALKHQATMFKSGAQLGEQAALLDAFPALVRLVGFNPEVVRGSLNIGGSLAGAAARDPVITGMLARFGEQDAFQLGRQHVLTGAFGASVESALPAGEAERAEGVSPQVEARLQELSGEIDKRMSGEQSKAIVELKKQLADQRKANDALVKRLDALEKRITP